MPITSDQELWACALAIEREHGAGAFLQAAKEIDRLDSEGKREAHTRLHLDGGHGLSRRALAARDGCEPLSVPAASQPRQDALRRRLGPYWKMEAANTVLLPAFVLWVAPPQSAVQFAATSLSLAAACILQAGQKPCSFKIQLSSIGKTAPRASP